MTNSPESSRAEDIAAADKLIKESPLLDIDPHTAEMRKKEFTIADGVEIDPGDFLAERLEVLKNPTPVHQFIEDNTGALEEIVKNDKE